jgi:hypothetical protein
LLVNDIGGVIIGTSKHLCNNRSDKGGKKQQGDKQARWAATAKRQADIRRSINLLHFERSRLDIAPTINHIDIDILITSRKMNLVKIDACSLKTTPTARLAFNIYLSGA